MRKEGRRWLMVVLLVATTILIGAMTAVQAAEVTEVRRYAPAGPPPDAEFEVRLKITGELPLVVGIVETIPEGFRFLSTTHPERSYNVSGQKVAFAVINETEIRYRVKAPSSGKGTFSGMWIDMLSENERRIADTIVMVGGVDADADAIEAPAVAPRPRPYVPAITPIPTPYVVPAVTKATRSIPVMEAGKEVSIVFREMNVSLIALKADKNLSDVVVTVERVERMPDIPAPPGIVYIYLDISVKNVRDAKVEGKVEFKVANSWIAANKIDETMVKLTRYEGGEWQTLPTYKVGEENATVYFEAKVSEFSIFAVTGEKKVEIAPTPTPEPVVTPPPRPAPRVPGFEAIFAAVALIAVLFVIRKRKKGGDKE